MLAFLAAPGNVLHNLNDLLVKLLNRNIVYANIQEYLCTY